MARTKIPQSSVSRRKSGSPEVLTLAAVLFDILLSTKGLHRIGRDPVRVGK